MKINDKKWILQSQVCNYWLRTGKVIATCFGDLEDIQNDCKKYDNDNIQFYVVKQLKHTISKGYFYIVRVIEGYQNEHGSLQEEL